MSPKSPKIHSTDKSLIDAATGSGAVALTPELLEQMRQNYQENMKDIAERYPKLVAACDYETRLAITAQVFKAIVDHARESGTYRYLIYERLGFGPDAYVPLYEAGGMEISNEFELPPLDGSKESH
jgi:hypothetical protein